MASLGGSEQLRAQLLTVLQDKAAFEGSDRPMTTAELRDHLHVHFASRAVIETVYRNLTVLERRGDVQRHPGPGRDAYWGATAATPRSARSRPA